MDFRDTLRVIELLGEATTCSSALDKIKRLTLDKVSKEFYCSNEKRKENVSVMINLLQAIQHLMRHCKGCFMVLEDAGITELMAGLVRQIMKNLTSDEWENDIPVLVESCTEAILAIADSDPAARSKVITTLLICLFELLEHPALVFKSKIEVLKSVNILLEQCPIQIKEQFLNEEANSKGIIAFVEMITTIGDYEFQVCMIECLMRLFPRKARQKYAETFFQDQKLIDEFLMIRDKVFETDCRIFLNNANARNEDPTKGVYSFPCSAAYIGDKQLRKPNDENYEEFWVDFNIGSTRITLFCEQDGINSQGSQMDEDMWETLEICKSNIKKYAISVEEGIVALDINLKTSIDELYPSQHPTEQGDSVTIEFHLDLEEYIAHAVNYTFSFERQKNSKVSTVEFPIQISVKDQDIHEENVKKTREQHVNYTCNSHDDNGSQGSQSKRRKVSVPQVPLKLNSAPSHTSTLPVNNQTNKHGGTLKAKATPIKSSKISVKTPVVEFCNPVKKDKGDKSNPPKDAQKKKTKDKEEVKATSQNLEWNQNKDRQKDKNNCKDEVNSTSGSLESNQIKKRQKEENKSKDEVEATDVDLDSNQDKQKEKATRKDNTDSTCQNPEVKDSSERPKQKKTRKSKHMGKSSQEDIIIPESQVFQDGVSMDADSGKHSKDSKTTKSKSITTNNENQEIDESSVCKPNFQSVESNIANCNTKVSVPQDFQEKKKKEDSSISNTTENAPEKLALPEKEKKKNVSHQIKCDSKDLEENNLSKNNFGFDDLGEVDRVPESLEIKNSDPNEAVAFGNEGNVNGEIRLNKEDEQDEIQVHEDESNLDHSKERKLSKKKADLNKKNASKEKVKPSFKDVDSSLKELCDLDEHEALKEKKHTNIDKKMDKKSKANNPMLEERRPLSQEEVDSIYTFQDPDDENVEKICLNREKKTSKQVKSVNPESPKKKFKRRSKKSKQGSKEKECSEIVDQKSNKENNTNVKKGAKVSDKTASSKLSINFKESENRSLRSRRQKPNYKDIDTDVESTCLDRSEINDSVESLTDNEPINVTDNAGKMAAKDKECKISEIEQQNQTDSTAKINTENASTEGKIVTVNSDDSDIGMDEDTNMPEFDEDDSLVSEPDKDNESVGDSLYVETDDSCNARSYKINCKERKKRRSSLKKIVSKKSDSATAIDFDKREIRVLNKSVSFDDSVLNDISPIKKPAHEKPPAKKGGKSKHQDTKSKRGKDNKQKNENSDMNDQDISLKPHSRRRTKTSPVQVSYSKSEAKNRPWSSLVQTSSRGKPGTGYDPFDFDEQIDNSSNRSERIGRLDISNELNKKHGSKPAKQSGKANNSKSKSKVSSIDKSNNSSNKIRSSKIKKEPDFEIQENEDRNCSMFGNQSDDHDSEQSPALMVQDYTTKKWHRSNVSKKGAKHEKIEQEKTNPNQKEKKSALNNSSPVNSDTDSSVQNNETSEDGNLYIESNNRLESILKAFQCNRHKDKDTRAKTAYYFGEYPDPSGQGNDICISPIQTPHLSSFSTPKVANRRRKHYTPLNISVITPQSATPGINEKGMLNLQSDEENVSNDNYREIKSTSSNEKSWIKSKLKPQRKKKTPVTYKHRRKAKTTYYNEESESQSEDSNGEARNQLSKDRETKNQKLDNLKSCFVHLEDIMLASEPNEEEEEADVVSCIASVSGIPESCVSSLVHDVTSRLKMQNLDELILSPYTPIKSENARTTSEENNISLIQTQENYSIRMDNQDREESFSFYDSKLHKHTLMGDSGFQSGPSSAVRPTSNDLKRRYPLLSDHDDDDSDLSEEERDNFSFIPKKLFKFDPSVSVKEKIHKYEDLQSSPVLTQECSTNFGYDTGFSSFLNSFGSDIKRQMERKREQVDTFTKQAVKELHKHHSQNWVVQQQYRSNVDVEFKTKMLVELEELERDIDLLKQAGQKTTELYKYQLDVLQRNKTRQTSSLNNMKNIQSYLMDKSRKVEKHNKDLQTNLKDLWKKDIMSLQRKLIDQQQKEELMNAKRNLQRTFSTSMIW